MTILYQCNKCNRQIDLITTVPAMYRCVISADCNGEMFFIKYNKNISRGQEPPATDYIDWIKQDHIFTFNQVKPVKNWRLKHQLNNHPEVLVFNYIDNVLERVYDYELTYIDNEYINIKFRQPRSGAAQLLSYDKSIDTYDIETSDQYFKCTKNRYLTVATHTHIESLNYLPPIMLGSRLITDYPLTTNNPYLAWGRTHDNVPIFDVTIFGNIFKVNTFQIAFSNEKLFFNKEFVFEEKPIYILLSNSTDPIDKIYDRVVLLSDLNSTNNEIRNGELYCSPSIIRDCYPNVLVNNP